MKDFQNDLMIKLRNPDYAASYIEAAIEENDSDFLQVALKDVVNAYGFKNVSDVTGIARQAVYKMVSKNGNPTIKNLIKILNSVGLEITIKPRSV